MSGPNATGRLDPETRRILVVLPTWVGDTVMATGVLDALRTARPATHIAGLVRPGLDELLDGGAWLDELIRSGGRGLLTPLRLARTIRRHRFDAALLLPNSFRSALTVRLAGVRRRIGYDRDGRRLLLTDAIPVSNPGDPVATVDYYRRLAEEVLGVDAIDATPRLAVTDTQQAEADRLLEGVERPLAVMSPGAVRPPKRWPAERFAAVANTLIRDRGMDVAVTGAPGETDVVRDVIAGIAGSTPLNLIDRGVRLGSLKGVLRRAAVLITNDTGPRHVAAALGTAVISLFGPTDHRWTTLPGAREHALLADPFLPEQIVADDVPRQCRIDRITVPDVLAAVERLLDAPSDHARSAPPA